MQIPKGIEKKLNVPEQAKPQIAAGVLLLLVGIPIYIKYSPKKELTEVKQSLISEQNIFRRMYRQEHVFLANVIYHLGEYHRRLMRKPKKTALTNSQTINYPSQTLV